MTKIHQLYEQQSLAEQLAGVEPIKLPRQKVICSCGRISMVGKDDYHATICKCGKNYRYQDDQAYVPTWQQKPRPSVMIWNHFTWALGGWLLCCMMWTLLWFLS